MTKKDFLTKISSDIDILHLLCEIVAKRLFILDDMEFVGDRQSLSSAFLPLEMTEKISLFLNYLAY
jgi:hypothetical protein